MLPAAQQHGRNLAGGGGLVQFVQPALAELVGTVTGKIGSRHQFPGEGMHGRHRPADLHGHGTSGSHQRFDTAGSAGKVGIHKCAQLALADGAGNVGKREGQLRPDRRHERAQHQQLGFQAHAGLEVLGGPDAPPPSGIVNQQRSVKVRGIVRGTGNAGGGQPRDGSAGHCSQFHGSPFHIPNRMGRCVPNNHSAAASRLNREENLRCAAPAGANYSLGGVSQYGRWYEYPGTASIRFSPGFVAARPDCRGPRLRSPRRPRPL